MTNGMALRETGSLTFRGINDVNTSCPQDSSQKCCYECYEGGMTGTVETFEGKK